MSKRSWFPLLVALVCLAAAAAVAAEELLRYAGAATLQRSFMP